MAKLLRFNEWAGTVPVQESLNVLPFEYVNGGPMATLARLKYSKDGQFCVLEGRLYSTQTGEEVAINEDWSLSDVLHAGADLLSAGLDFVVPGSGAIVDAINAISYVVEAQFKPEEERDSLYVMAVITAGFIFVPAALQTIAIPLKAALKTGKGLASPLVKSALSMIKPFTDLILKKMPELVDRAMKSQLGKKVLGPMADRISGAISKFRERARKIMGKIEGSGGAAAGKKTAAKAGARFEISAAAKSALTSFYKKSPLFPLTNVPVFFRKMGLAQGKTYRYVGATGNKVTTVLLKELPKAGSKEATVVFGKGAAMVVPVETLAKRIVIEPWLRNGSSVMVPLFVKRLADSLNSAGEIDWQKLEGMLDMDPTAVSQESLAYLQEEVAGYEGDAGSYTINSSVQAFQQALVALGHSLPRFGADGKFGPETKTALEEFQKNNGLTSSLGKMDRLTAQKMSELLTAQGTSGSDQIIASLNTMTAKPTVA
jgi:hypothetical protein